MNICSNLDTEDLKNRNIIVNADRIIAEDVIIITPKSRYVIPSVLMVKGTIGKIIDINKSNSEICALFNCKILCEAYDLDKEEYTHQEYPVFEMNIPITSVELLEISSDGDNKK